MPLRAIALGSADVVEIVCALTVCDYGNDHATKRREQRNVTGLSRHHRGADPEDTHNSENTERDPPLTLCLLGCAGVRSSVCFATMPRSGITHFERDQLFIGATH